MSHQSSLRRRLLAVGTAVAALAGGLTADAHAASYDVYSCATPNGAPAPIADESGGWRPEGDTGAAERATDGCASSAPLVASISRQHDAPYGRSVWWQFRAPAGTRITSYDLLWSGWTAGDRNWAGHAYIQQGGGQVVASEHSRHQEFEPRWISRSGVDIDHINVAASCVSQPVCVTGAGFVVHSRMHLSRFTLRDLSRPEAAQHGGSLVRDESLSGTESIALSGQDHGGGVYRAVLWVDGEAVQREVLDRNGGRCAEYDEGNGTPEFVHPRPCAPRTSGVFAVDTRKLAEGWHDVQVTLEDAAGNHGVAYGPERKLVDNVPKPSVAGAPVISGTGAVGRTLQLTPTIWNAHGAAAPTVTRVWQRCHSVEERCVTVAGRAGTAYDLEADDAGKRLRVIETARNTEGETVATSSFTRIVTRADGTLPEDGNGIDDDGDGQIDEAGERRPVTTADNGKDDDCDGQIDEAGEQLVVGACNNGRDDDGDGQVDEPGETGPSGGAGGTTGTSGVPGTPGAPGAAGTNGRDGASSSTTSTSTTTVAGNTTVVNGTGASRQARLQVSFRGSRGKTRTLTFRGRAVVTGRLVDEAGRGISGAGLTVTETTAVRGAAAQSRPAVTTGADGRFTYRVAARRSSRTVRFAYAYERGGAAVAQAEMVVRVRAAASLAVSLRGVDVTYRGRVVSGPRPANGKLVIVQGRAKGGTWQTFASPRTNRAGAFTGRYRLKVRNPGRKLQFRVRVVTESGYAYLAGTSRTVTRTVR
jgi:hypothetical protein